MAGSFPNSLRMSSNEWGGEICLLGKPHYSVANVEMPSDGSDPAVRKSLQDFLSPVGFRVLGK